MIRTKDAKKDGLFYLNIKVYGEIVVERMRLCKDKWMWETRRRQLTMTSVSKEGEREREKERVQRSERIESKSF